LRRDRGDVDFAARACGFARDFVNAAFLVNAQHRTFSDARAGNQTGDAGERSKMSRQAKQALDIECAGMIKRCDMRDKESAEPIMKR
jgi:hypothetical protein